MKDKVVVITGGSSGIGKALATTFGKNGANIFITGRNAHELDLVIEELKKQHITIAGIPADVSVISDNQKMVCEAMRRYGRIDVLINNAGITMRAPFGEVDFSVIEKVMNINFFGALYATQACLSEILKTKGSIVGISSIAGYRGLPGRTGYSASKFALRGFLETLRTELLNTGVHVLIACPGFTASNTRKRALNAKGLEQGESPRNEQTMMTAEECAEKIYSATVRRKNILILTLQGKITVFLSKFMPSSWMDKMVYRTIAKEPNSPFK